MATSGLDVANIVFLAVVECLRACNGARYWSIGGGLSEYVQFGEAMVLFIAILIGSYFFVLISPGARENS
jgi:hypothetical protein